MLRATLCLFTFVAVALVMAPQAFADAKSDRAAMADAATKLSTSATSLASTAKASDDRGARKKFAPAAQDIADDLAAFARRVVKDVPMKSLANDLTGILKDAAALVELADEAEEKDERKALRASAQLLQQGIANVGKQLLAAAANEEKGGAQPAAAPKRFTGRLFNDSDKCSWDENLVFQVSREGQVVFKSGLVFPGKNQALVLEQGTYLVQLLKGGSQEFLGQKALEVKAEGWQFLSGCVNQD